VASMLQRATDAYAAGKETEGEWLRKAHTAAEIPMSFEGLREVGDCGFTAAGQRRHAGEPVACFPRQPRPDSARHSVQSARDHVERHGVPMPRGQQAPRSGVLTRQRSAASDVALSEPSLRSSRRSSR
jgi:hypothetical protein